MIPLIRGSATQVFGDEMAVDADMLNSIPASNIAMIKVSKGYFVGSRSGSGAKAIYKRRGGMEPASSAPSFFSSILVGYQNQQQFFQPDYTQENLRNTPDQRAVLFLNHLPYFKAGYTTNAGYIL